MFTAAQRMTVIPPGPPSEPRLSLADVHLERTVLAGGWWPRSRDPVAELPGLILALNDRFGPIRQLLLNAESWDGRFRRLAVGGRDVRVEWFSTVQPGTLTATTDHGDEIDLLVVPPQATAAAANGAMTAASDPDNQLRAGAVLTAFHADGDHGEPGS
jgi:Family of unknown function (DUF5994)